MRYFNKRIDAPNTDHYFEDMFNGCFDDWFQSEVYRIDSEKHWGNPQERNIFYERHLPSRPFID